MNSSEILEKLKTRYDALESKEEHGLLSVWVLPQKIRPVMEFLRNEYQFGQLSFLTAVDFPQNNTIEMVYDLFAYETGDHLVIKVKLDRSNPGLETISDIFMTANWHEREAAEMFGVKFFNHPDPNRLLLPDGIEMPLRKDFVHEDMIPLPKV